MPCVAFSLITRSLFKSKRVHFRKYLKPNEVRHCQRSFASAYTNKDVKKSFVKSRVSEFSGKESELFQSETVQSILQRMTSVDLDKVFQGRKEALKNATYKLLDNEELKKVLQIM